MIVIEIHSFLSQMGREEIRRRDGSGKGRRGEERMCGRRPKWWRRNSQWWEGFP
jgi:hypothetical protein